MKFNLKNHPRKGNEFFGPEQVEWWFEGFEKELQEIIKNYSKRSDEWERGVAIFIKEEILGE